MKERRSLKRDQTDGFRYDEGVKRTDIDCHSCSKIFVAKINFDLSGNHVIICPLCGHQHFRVILDGVVTIGRYSSQSGPNIDVPTERKWSNTTIGAETNTAAEYIRQKWIAR